MTTPWPLEPPSTEPPPSGIKIHNWPDAKDPIDDETKLIRYMKLETFLLMLNSRVFIPTLECLRRLDHLESRIPQRFHGLKYPEAMKQVVQGHEDWLDQVTTGKKVPIDTGGPTDERPSS